MGIFGTSSTFDQDVERATSENNTSEEWGLIMEICDRAGASPLNAKDCLRAVLRRLAHPDPHVQVHAATLLDACVANCGRTFHLEVASRDFVTEFRRLLTRAQPAIAARLRAMLRKWAEGEFRDDPQLDLIPSLNAKLRSEGVEATAATAPTSSPSSPASESAAAARREREDLARAIALSLRDSNPAVTSTPRGTLYPRVDAPPDSTPRRVRAIYDFEAAEDNELTFVAGEIVHVTDSSDPNWWRGYNSRGEGLFPSNFVTSESEAAAAERAAVESSTGPGAAAGAEEEEEPETAIEARDIDEAEMDAVLAALHEADPAVAGRGEARLAAREARALAMGALVDAALERADTRHARLTQLSAELVDALNLYHELMRAPPPPPPHAAMYAGFPQQVIHPPPPPPPPHHR